MGILEKIGISGPSIDHLFEELSDLAGKYQALAGRMHRHAEQCTYPATKSALEKSAAKETEHAAALAALLTEHRRWARLVELPAREGTNNWERLTGDLAILSELSGDLGRLATHWNTLDPNLGDRLQPIVTQDIDVVAELRKLALRADPQALD